MPRHPTLSQAIKAHTKSGGEVYVDTARQNQDAVGGSHTHPGGAATYREVRALDNPTEDNIRPLLVLPFDIPRSMMKDIFPSSDTALFVLS